MGELGGSVITGCDGNPLAVVARQLGAQLHNIRNMCVAHDYIFVYYAGMQACSDVSVASQMPDL